jgi:glycine/D-amino acid oxidase-like deaminating enzyme
VSLTRHYDVAVLRYGGRWGVLLRIGWRGAGIRWSASTASRHRIVREATAATAGCIEWRIPNAQVTFLWLAKLGDCGTIWGKFGGELLHRIGMLHMGNPESDFFGYVAECARVHMIEMQRLQAEEVRQRYPVFQIPDEYVGMFDPEAGWIDVHAALLQSRSEAELLGAEIHLHSQVLGWKATKGSETVQTADGEYQALRLIVTAGAWANTLLRDLGLPLTVRRKVLAWFEPLAPQMFDEGWAPVFTFPENWIYGFPDIHGQGVKLAEHLGGEDVASADGEIAAPNAADIDPIRATMAKYTPSLAGAPPGSVAKLLRSEVCLYKLTSDEDFLIDHHPEHPEVVFAAGFSGHGFKFAPLIGQALAELAINARTVINIDFMALRRFPQTAIRPAGGHLS